MGASIDRIDMLASASTPTRDRGTGFDLEFGPEDSPVEPMHTIELEYTST